MLNLDFKRGTHICHLYEGAHELKEVSLDFVLDGLKNGECCVYVADEASVGDWFLEFQTHGIDVRSARDEGSLEVVLSEQWRSASLAGSVRMARSFLELYKEKRDKFAGFRIAGDGAWGTNPAVPPDQLCHWEATVNIAVEDLDALVICQYDLNSYEPQFIHAALRTHPIVIYQGRTLVNPFNEAALILQEEPRLNASSSDAQLVAGMLRELSSLS